YRLGLARLHLDPLDPPLSSTLGVRANGPVGDHNAGHQEPHLRKLIEQPMKVCRLLIHQDHAVADAMIVSISGDGIAKCL
ncbi:hypothetical protein, partial [Rhizobium johnstonii]|uniref:hypothetical protein n=1 Tax=Rhizobium johnstonii TaxID=3019933 RepID=UPI003F95E620